MEEKNILTESDRNWAMFCHLSAFAGGFIPLGSLLGPLVCWLARRDISPWVDKNGKAALNFQLSMLLYLVLCVPLLFIVVGIPLFIVLWIVRFVFIIISAVKASKGEDCKYPLAIPFIQ